MALSKKIWVYIYIYIYIYIYKRDSFGLRNTKECSMTYRQTVYIYIYINPNLFR